MTTYNPKEFSSALKQIRKRSGKSRYKLAQFSGLDEGYLGRLESGKRRNSSRDTVVKIGLALVEDSTQVFMHDVNQLLLSAGYAPLLSR